MAEMITVCDLVSERNAMVSWAREREMARTRRADPPAIAQPTRCASQWILPSLQKPDCSTAWVLSDGQLMTVSGKDKGKENDEF
jgi:hypothetical protein